MQNLINFTICLANIALEKFVVFCVNSTEFSRKKIFGKPEKIFD
jgi:hypothetical protein